jgi:inner membrane protein YidH
MLRVTSSAWETPFEVARGQRLRLFEKIFKKGKLDEPYRPERDAEIREHLANERTLLSWVRTGVSLLSVGFVIERAGALAAGSLGAEGQDTALASEIFGLALIALGCLTLIVGSVQFFRNRRMIREGVFTTRPAPYMIIVVLSLALAVAFVVYTLA